MMRRTGDSWLISDIYRDCAIVLKEKLSTTRTVELSLTLAGAAIIVAWHSWGEAGVSGLGAPYALVATGLQFAPAYDQGALNPGCMPLFVALIVTIDAHAILRVNETIQTSRPSTPTLGLHLTLWHPLTWQDRLLRIPIPLLASAWCLSPANPEEIQAH
jgi:hypothetical protein